MELIIKGLENFEVAMHMLTAKHVASSKILLCQIFTFVNLPYLRPLTSIHEPVDITC